VVAVVGLARYDARLLHREKENVVRLFELILLVLLLVIVIQRVFQVRRRVDITNRWLVPAIAAGVCVLHLLAEGARWQMYPAYALLVILLVLAQRPATYSAAGKGKRLGLSGAYAGAVLVLAFSAFFAWALPVPVLPGPSGPYPVGTATFHWIDESRQELYTDAPDDVRELMVQVWYPAAPIEGSSPAPWLQNAPTLAPAIAEELGMPGFLFSHFDLVQAHSHADAPVAAEGPFPAIVYSHGWTGFRAINTDQSEDLASHGYIVVAPDHSYGALGTIFPDGKLVLNNPDALPSQERVGEEAYQVAIEQLVDTYAGDIRFVIDQMERMAAGEIPHPLGPQLDLSRLGVFGHSTGGGATVEAAARDPRVKAAFGQDVWAKPVSEDVRSTPLKTPFVIFNSESWSDDENTAVLDRIYDQAKGARYWMYIDDSAHADFTLFAVVSPVAWLGGLKGPIDGERVLAINQVYLRAFFNHFLKGESAPLLEGPSKEYPEVVWKDQEVGNS
jgi:predicted dienelactone hydrolase